MHKLLFFRRGNVMKSPALGNASFKRAPQIMQQIRKQQLLLAYARDDDQKAEEKAAAEAGII